MIAGGFSRRNPRFNLLDRWMTRFRPHDACGLAALSSRKLAASGRRALVAGFGQIEAQVMRSEWLPRPPESQSPQCKSKKGSLPPYLSSGCIPESL
jgi:hypothetical protein